MTGLRAYFSLRLVLSLATLVGAARIAHGEEVGTIAAVEGSAEIGRDDAWVAAAPGATVAVGDQLRTGQPGRIRVVFRDDSVLVLGDGSSLVINEQVFDPNAPQSVFGLLGGKLRSIVSHYYGSEGSAFEVKTPTAVAGVRGTEFVVTYDPATGATEVVGIRGVVTVHSAVDPAGPGLLVTANEATAVNAGELPSQPQHLDPERMRQLLHDMEFFGSNPQTNLTDASSLIAGAFVPRPAQAPASASVGGGALGLAPDGPPSALDASAALGNSPAAVIGGSGKGSITVNPGQR